MNSFETYVKMKRIDICDLLLACLAAKSLANDAGAKWNRLHDMLKQQLEDLDRQLNEVRNG